MTRYAGFDSLRELTKLTKTDRGYTKFIQTGKLSLYDYNTGFIDLHIYSFLSHRKVPTVRLGFGTIDDGDFGGWKDCSDMLEANSLVEQIATKVFADMVSFPDDDTLNRLLAPYGVYVCYE